MRSFQIFYRTAILVQNDSGKNVSVVKQQRCTLLVHDVRAVGMNESCLPSENLAQSMGDGLIK